MNEGSTGLTVGPEEGWREETLVHQSRERNNTNHVVGVKGQTAERLTAQLLCEENNNKSSINYTKSLNTRLAQGGEPVPSSIFGLSGEYLRSRKESLFTTSKKKIKKFTVH